MKRFAVLGGAILALVLASSAGALLTPGRTLTAPAPVTALSVTNRVVVYAVGRTRTSCGSVVLWDTPRLGHWTFGSRTILGCEEGPSGGFGISSVAVTGDRAFWLTRIGGNITDWQLWSATPTRRVARRLAFASADTDGPPAIVLGQGTNDGVPYAVGQTVTFVSRPAHACSAPRSTRRCASSPPLSALVRPCRRRARRRARRPPVAERASRCGQTTTGLRRCERSHSGSSAPSSRSARP